MSYILAVSYTHLDVYKRQEPGIEHIFSELYLVPQQIKGDYYKVKALELLLYLDALQFSDSKEDRPYFYKAVSYTHLDVYKRQRS